jgi:hypothetical protein
MSQKKKVLTGNLGGAPGPRGRTSSHRNKAVCRDENSNYGPIGCSAGKSHYAKQSWQALPVVYYRGGFAMQERLGVLIVAENASMSQGGESRLALQWFLELLKAGVDVHLLVHIRSKRELDQSVSRFASRIHYVSDVLLQKIFWNLGKALPTSGASPASGWST